MVTVSSIHAMEYDPMVDNDQLTVCNVETTGDQYGNGEGMPLEIVIHITDDSSLSSSHETQSGIIAALRGIVLRSRTLLWFVGKMPKGL